MTANLSTDFDIGFITRGVFKNHPTEPGIYTTRGVLPAPFSFTNNSGRSGFCSLIDTDYTPPDRNPEATSADTVDGIAWKKPYLSGDFPNFDIGIGPGGMIYTAPDGSTWFAYISFEQGTATHAALRVIFYRFGVFGQTASAVQTVNVTTPHKNVSYPAASLKTEFDVLQNGSKAILNTYSEQPCYYGGTYSDNLTYPALMGSLLVEISGVPPSAAVTLTSLAHDGEVGDPLDINGGSDMVVTTKWETIHDPLYPFGDAQFETKYTRSQTTLPKGIISGCFFREDGSVAYMGARFSYTGERITSNLVHIQPPPSEGGNPTSSVRAMSEATSSLTYEVYLDTTVVLTLTGEYSHESALEECDVSALQIWHGVIGRPGDGSWSLSFDGVSVSPSPVYVGVDTLFPLFPDPQYWWQNTDDTMRKTLRVHHVSNNMLLVARYDKSMIPLQESQATLLAYGTPTNLTQGNINMGTDPDEFIKYGSRNPETGEVIVAPYPVCYV